MNNFDQLKKIEINGETILPITLYGPNRSNDVNEWQRRVMTDYLGIPINQLQAPFPSVSHGSVMNYVTAHTIDNPSLRPDYYLWLDNDAIFLRHGVLERMYEFVKDKETIYGQAFMSNHKLGPNGTKFHVYCSQACLLFPTDLYNKLGRPDLDHHHSRSDTAEELSYVAKKRGYTVVLSYPSHSVIGDTDLDQDCKYGLSITYGNNFTYHCSQANHPRHVELFVEKAKEVISGKYEHQKK